MNIMDFAPFSIREEGGAGVSAPERVLGIAQDLAVSPSAGKRRYRSPNTSARVVCRVERDSGAS